MPYTFSWNFGDGTTGSGNPVSHTFSSTGTYTQIVTVTDSIGNVATGKDTVLVSSIPQPSTSQTGLIVPLYIYPSTAWQTLISLKQAYPQLPMVAVINPNSGPGSYYDSNYASGITSLKNAGIQVLGYVWTCYGSRVLRGSGVLNNTSCAPLGYAYYSGTEDDIDTYVSWYPNIDGILFDEMSAGSGAESYYQTIANYVKSVGFSLAFANPGTSPTSTYIGIMDNLVIWENGYMPSVSNLSWTTNYGKNGFSYVAYSVGGLDSALIASLNPYVGYAYITDAGLPNPYDVLPSYLTQLAQDLLG